MSLLATVLTFVVFLLDWQGEPFALHARHEGQARAILTVPCRREAPLPHQQAMSRSRT